MFLQLCALKYIPQYIIYLFIQLLNALLFIISTQFEPVIQPGNEGFVHHITVYACYGEISDDSHGEAWDCLWEVMPDQHKCATLLFVWAVGGNVGIKYSMNVEHFLKHQIYFEI